MFEPEFEKSKMKYLDPTYEGSQIEEMARGMSQDEVCDFFGVTLDDLHKSSEDFDFFRYHYKMGRANGNREAVGALFDAMRNQRTGGQVALSYLSRFAQDFAGEVEADKELASKKSFRIILD